MAGPYRESNATPVACPRCTEPLPAKPLAVCLHECGIWVAAAEAPSVFESSELAPSRLTSWRHTKAPCPHCNAQMKLHGHDMALFLGCTEHGYWVDSDAIKQTGLGRVAVAGRLKQAFAVIDGAKAERARIERAAREQEEAERRALAEQDAARRRDTVAREEAERRERAKREAACAPYAALVRAAIYNRDVLPLAEKLMKLDEELGALTKRLAELANVAR